MVGGPHIILFKHKTHSAKNMDKINKECRAKYSFCDIYLLAASADGDSAAMDGRSKEFAGMDRLLRPNEIIRCSARGWPNQAWRNKQFVDYLTKSVSNGKKCLIIFE